MEDAAASGAREALETIYGVSLAQYAAVKAAVAEGFSLEEVLAVEGQVRGLFARADLEWKQRIAGDHRQLAAYAGELARAENWLGRSIRPLDQDAAGWVSFLAALHGCSDAGALLQTCGLGMNDVARLKRRWMQRAEEDEALAKKLAELARAPGPFPRIEAELPVLRPSRVAKKRLAVEERGVQGRAVPPLPVKATPPAATLHETAPVLSLPQGPVLPFQEGAKLAMTAPVVAVPKGPVLPFREAGPALAQTSLRLEIPRELVRASSAADVKPAGPLPELSLEAYASLCAKLAVSPEDAEQIFERYGLASPDARNAVDEVWKERLRREPKLYEEWQQLYRMFYARWSQQERR